MKLTLPSKSSQKPLRRIASAMDAFRQELLTWGKNKYGDVLPWVGEAEEGTRQQLNEALSHLLLGTALSLPIPSELMEELKASGVESGAEFLIAQAHEGTLAQKLELDENGRAIFCGRAAKRATGSYYTPPSIARDLTGRALQAFTKGKDCSLADPACGSGMFLLAAIDYYATQKLSGKLLMMGVERHGPTAALARILVQSRCEQQGVRGRVTYEILEGDALVDIDWPRDFDVVIGNPPFLAEVRGQAEKFIKYRETSLVGAYYLHKMDLLYFFMALAIEILRPGGILALVVADYWTSRASATTLRKAILTKTKILEYLALGDHRLFRQAIGCHAALLVARKGSQKEGETDSFSLVRYAGAGTAHAFRQGTGRVIVNSHSVSLLFSDEANVLKRLQDTANASLVNKAYVQGLVAPQTRLGMPRRGRRNFDDGEGVFVLTEKELASLSLSEREKSVVRPYYWATQVLPYYLKGEHLGNLLYMDRQKRKEMKEHWDEFSALRAHFDKYSSHMTSAFKPYGLHRPRQLRCFTGEERLVGVRKAAYPKFCLIPKGKEVFVGEACFVLLDLSKIPLPYLLLVLNSTVAHFWLAHRKAQGRHIQVDKEPLLSVPIYRPMAAVEEALVSTVRRLISKENVDWPSVYRAFDRIVYALYNLSPQQTAVIERAVMQGARGGAAFELPTLQSALDDVGLSQLPSSLLSSKEKVSDR